MEQHLGRESFLLPPGWSWTRPPKWPHKEHCTWIALHPPLSPRQQDLPKALPEQVRYYPPTLATFISLAERLSKLKPEGRCCFPDKGGHLQRLSLKNACPFGELCRDYLFSVNKKHCVKFYRTVEYIFCTLKKIVCAISAAIEGRSLLDWNVGRNKENPCSFPPAIIVLLACKAHRFPVRSSMQYGRGPAVRVIGFLATFNTEVEGSWTEGPLLLGWTGVELCRNPPHLPEPMCSIKY